MRAANLLIAVMILLAAETYGQTTSTNAPPVSESSSTNSQGVAPPAGDRAEAVIPAERGGAQPAHEAEAGKSWAFSVSAYGYFVPDGQDYAQPTVTADHDWLHLEGRYNYEALQTGSAWVGYNLGGGDKLSWEVTPMVGAVFGELTGIAPGYKGSLNWWKLELYSEGEYVFDPGNSSNNFFYNWSELSIAPLGWLRLGMVTQHTRAYQTDREVQRGVLVGFTYKHAAFTTYVFNPDESKPTVAIAFALSF